MYEDNFIYIEDKFYQQILINVVIHTLTPLLIETALMYSPNIWLVQGCIGKE